MLHCSSEKSGCAARCVKFGLLAVVGIGALGWLVMSLWNGLLPDIFAGVARIDYWQALGLLLLSRILFGGLRGGCASHWRERRAQWDKLTPEEREQLKGRFHRRWGNCCGTAQEQPAAGGEGPAERS